MEKKKKIVSITALVVGLITLIVGVVFLVINLTKVSSMQDGEFLVEKGNWTLENESGVVWDFKEDGKGSLTTNEHVNDYDFTWEITDGKLKIQTEWLYSLENEYTYQLDQGAGVLTLSDETTTYKFVAEK